MTRLLSAFGKAASLTVRGAAVTFGSTLFSCAAACSIEKGANRMILKHYPHKLVNVEAASGITQEELNLVKLHYGGGIVAATNQAATEDDSSTTTTRTEMEESELLFRYDSFDESSVEYSSQYNELNSQIATTDTAGGNASQQEEEQEKSTINKFWTEEDTAAKYISMIPIIVPRQEILACSMTA